ncbi:MAG: cupin domain-containing protein [Synergistaceae bacterium]|nr:cupin domain-containing protein [Synergistaceae bacterium]
MQRGNLFTPVTRTDDEFVEILKAGHSRKIRIERIVSQGHVSPAGFWYDQSEWEYVAVLQGCAELETLDGKIWLEAGDWVMIPEHEKHRVSYTSSEPACVWLAVFESSET